MRFDTYCEREVKFGFNFNEVEAGKKAKYFIRKKETHSIVNNSVGNIRRRLQHRTVHISAWPEDNLEKCAYSVNMVQELIKMFVNWGR